MTMRRIRFAVIFFVFLYPLEAIAEDKSPNFERILYSGFRTVEKFVIFDVDLDGSAEKLGVKKEELTDLLKLKFKNSFAGMKIEKAPPPEELYSKGPKFGAIFIIVWTVGDDYPIAFHISISAGNYVDLDLYQNAYLGITSKQYVSKVTRETISDLVDNLAIAFFKARGSM